MSAPPRRTPGLVSVIIPALDAALTIGDQLAALGRQAGAPPFEVVVADNGSTDGTSDVARRYEGSLPALVVVDASSVRGAGPARNAGATAASGDVLAFCDADDIVSAGWLAALERGLNASDFVTGPLVDLPTAASLPTQGGDAAYSTHTFIGGFRYAPSNNLAVRRDAFEAVGGFDATVLLAEDVDLSVRLSKVGVALSRADDAVVHARLRPNTRAYVRQHYRYGKWDVAVVARHRDVLRPERSRDVAQAWLGLVWWLPRLVGPADRRRTWLAPAAKRVGRIAGSIRWRTVCL